MADVKTTMRTSIANGQLVMVDFGQDVVEKYLDDSLKNEMASGSDTGKKLIELVALARRDEMSNLGNTNRAKLKECKSFDDVVKLFQKDFPNVTVSEYVPEEPKAKEVGIEAFVKKIKAQVAEGKITVEKAKELVAAKKKKIAEEAAKAASVEEDF